MTEFFQHQPVPGPIQIKEIHFQDLIAFHTYFLQSFDNFRFDEERMETEILERFGEVFGILTDDFLTNDSYLLRVAVGSLQFYHAVVGSLFVYFHRW